jgi:hypothetical protein
MPVGIIAQNDIYRSIFIHTLENKYYMPWPDECTLPKGTMVSFRVVNPPDPPPGFYYADQIKALPDPPLPPQLPAPPLQIPSPSVQLPSPSLPKPSGAWGKPLSPSIVAAQPLASTSSPTSNSNSSPSPLTIKTSVGPAQQTPSFKPKPLTNKQTSEDFEFIVQKVNSMKWDQQKGFGPSLQVTTKLKYEGEGKLLYLRVKDEFHDQLIPGQGFYYFVGTMGVNFGKGGFRISAHTKPLAQIDKSTTYTVLHIEN